MHLFSTRTSSGILYEVDARLRPSGEAGMLVSTIEAFADYQRNEAWTWEHQALVRARIVYGSPKLHQQFDAIRQQILCRHREDPQLQQEVREMREKMRNHLGSKQRDIFDIKADAGGITDIEFIAQYLVLRYAASEPRLTRWSDNVRILNRWLITTSCRRKRPPRSPVLMSRCVMRSIIWPCKNNRAKSQPTAL